MARYNIFDNTRATTRTEAVKIGTGIVFSTFMITKPSKKILVDNK